MATPTPPLDVKVTAATAGSAAAGFVLWLLATYVFRGDVPAPVAALIAIAVPAVLAFLAGYFKKTPTQALMARAAAAPETVATVNPRTDEVVAVSLPAARARNEDGTDVGPTSV